MKKILMIMYSLDPGGIESFVVNLIEHLNLSKMQVDVCIFNKRQEEKAFYEDRVLAAGAGVIKLWEGKNHYIGYFSRRKSLRKYLKQNRYDIVHIHGGFADDALDCLAAHGCGAERIILHSHMAGLKLSRQTWVQLALHYVMRALHAANLFATDYFACSKEAAAWMFGAYCVDRTRLIPNGIVAEDFLYSESDRQAYRRLLQLEDFFVIGNVGRLSGEKNQIFLVEILWRILQDENDCCLLILGEGEEKKNIEERAEALGVADRVKIVDNRYDVRRCYQAMDVFVMPSLAEGFGIACIEAQISGLKCIVSDRLPETTNITGTVRYLSLEQQADGWAEEILKVRGSKRLALSAEILKDAEFRIEHSAHLVEEYYYAGSME